MDRGIKDEAFVRRAFDVADSDCGRWVANQSIFHHKASEVLEPKTKALLVTSAAIFTQKNNWNEAVVNDALALNTYGEAREFVDRVFEMLPAIK